MACETFRVHQWLLDWRDYDAPPGERQRFLARASNGLK
jgi:hypothetical protein